MTGIFHVHQGRFGRITLFNTNQPVALHSHPQLHVLIKIAGQDGAYEVAGHGSCPITDDQFVLINPWVPHANPRETGGEATTILAFYIEMSWMNFGRGVLPAEVFSTAVAPTTPEIRTVARAIADRLPHGDARAEETERLLGELMEIILGSNSSAHLPRPARIPDHRIRRAIQIMRASPNFAVGLDDVAREVGLSRSHFFEMFRSSVGMSPGTYVDGLRLDAAIYMLLRDRPRLCDVSAQLGFAEPGHFSRFFRSKVGFSPREYRRVAAQLSSNAGGQGPPVLVGDTPGS